MSEPRYLRARIAVGRWRRSALTRLSERTIEERLVWIFGSPRSGSTWLLQLLSESPAVVPVNEPLIGWYLGPFLSDLPGWDPSALDVSNFTLRRVQADQPQQFFATEFAHAWRPGLADLMRKRFASHSVHYPPDGRSASKAIVAIKEPAGSQSADLILNCLPRSRLLFLLRDGRDVVDSELAANLKGSWVERQFPGARGLPESERLGFVRAAARRWLWRTEVVERAYADHPGPKYLLHYEDLLNDPRKHLAATLAWVGAEADAETVDAVIARYEFSKKPQANRGDQAFFRAATPGLWRESLSEAEQEAVDAVIGEKLRELGYRNER